jgi:hypothetical protein
LSQPDIERKWNGFSSGRRVYSPFHNLPSIAGPPSWGFANFMCKLWSSRTQQEPISGFKQLSKNVHAHTFSMDQYSTVRSGTELRAWRSPRIQAQVV